MNFEDFYQLYPVKKGKESGRKKYEKLTDFDKDLCLKALNNYKRELTERKTEKQYIKHFGTFMNNWRDYLVVDVVKFDSYDSRFSKEKQDELRGTFDYMEACRERNS